MGRAGDEALGDEGSPVGLGRGFSTDRVDERPERSPLRRCVAVVAPGTVLVGDIKELLRMGAEPGSRGIGFSITMTSNIALGVPTFFSADSFWCKYFASANSLNRDQILMIVRRGNDVKMLTSLLLQHWAALSSYTPRIIDD